MSPYRANVKPKEPKPVERKKPMLFWKKSACVFVGAGALEWALVNCAFVTDGMTRGNLIAAAIVVGIVALISGGVTVATHPDT